ncbi:Serine hydrolase, partial [Globisporangium splendens]
MPVVRKLRVLCMHGFRTNDKVMQHQTRALRNALGDKAEFTFLNGPYEAKGPTDAMTERDYGHLAPFYEWVAFRRVDSALFDESTLTAPSKEWCFEYIGFERMMEFMDEYLEREGPFDVALGFSQGAAVMTSLSMLYLQRNFRWWNLCVCFSGMSVRGFSMRPYFEKPNGGGRVQLPFPSIHVLGKSDKFYPELVKLAAVYEDEPKGAAVPKRVFEHDGGHVFPSADNNPGLYENIAELILQHCHSAKPASKI